MRPFRAPAPDDPAGLRVIAALDAVGAGRSTVVLPVPAAAFRADLRTQLVAVTPRLVGEGVLAEGGAPPRRSAVAAGSRRRATPDAPARRPLRARPMTVLVAGVAVVVLGLGGATWLARSALPGQPLYGLKRTAEGVDVSLSGSEVDKGTALLLDATTRVQEVEQLLQQPQSMAFGSGPTAGGALSADTIELVVSTLQDADSNTRKGVTKIGDDAIERGDATGLQVVVAWADGQKKSIATLVARIPASATKATAQAQTSFQQISIAYTRASDLDADVSNGVTCPPRRDDFGPVPCGASRSSAAPAPSTSPSPLPSTSATLSPSPSLSNATGGADGTATNSGGSTSAGTTPSVTPTPSAGNPTSTTQGADGPPVVSSSAPAVTIESCGVQVTLPVGGVSLGTCPPSP